MNLILCSREEESAVLAHGLFLCSQEQAEDYLMHWRTRGSKNGVRLYQYKDGSLTPLGYEHYGIGKGNKDRRKSEKYQDKANKHKMKAAKYQVKADKYSRKADKSEEKGKEQLAKDQQAEEEARKAKEEYVNKGASLNHIAEKFDNLSPENKKKAGDEILQYLDKSYKMLQEDFKNTRNSGYDYDHNKYIQYDELQAWMTDQVYEKSGSWNSGYFKPGTKGEKAYSVMDKAAHDLWNREDEVKKEIGFNPINSDPKSNWSKPTDTNSPTFRHNKAERDRLYRACKEDAVWKSLNEAYKKSESDLLGAILQDMGFSDTPQNRSILEPFAFLD